MLERYLTTPENLMQTKVTIFEDYVRLDILTEVKGLEKIRAGKI